MKQGDQRLHEQGVQAGVQFIHDEGEPLFQNVQDGAGEEEQVLGSAGFVHQVEYGLALLGNVMGLHFVHRLLADFFFPLAGRQVEANAADGGLGACHFDVGNAAV